MDYILQGFGVFLGVLAGVAITLLSQWITDRQQRNSKSRNLLFELQLNEKKIERWLEEIQAYRNAVNSETLFQYFGYFDYSKFVTVTADKMFVSGLLYQYLSHEDIGSLQEIFTYFSNSGEQYINNQIVNSKSSFDKTAATNNVNYHEKQLKTYKEKLVTISDNLRKKL